MLTFFLAIVVGWFLVSVLLGLVLGATLRRLESTPGRDIRNGQGWKLTSVTKKNGAPVLLLARITSSPAPPGRAQRQ
jgi:hypothetical protein